MYDDIVERIIKRYLAESVKPNLGNGTVSKGLESDLGIILKEELKSFGINPQIQNEIFQNYVEGYIAPNVGRNTQVGKTLTEGLEQLLDIGREVRQSQYSREEILDMYVEDFFDAHPHINGQKYPVKLYFNRAAKHISDISEHTPPPKKTIKVRQILEISEQDALKLNDIGPKRIQMVNAYLEMNYGLRIGMRAGEF